MVAFREPRGRLHVDEDQRVFYEDENLPHGIGGVQKIFLPEDQFNTVIRLNKGGSTVLRAKLETEASPGPKCFFWSKKNNRSRLFSNGTNLEERHEGSEYMQCYTLDSPEIQIVLSIESEFEHELVKLELQDDRIGRIRYSEIFEAGRVFDMTRFEIIEVPGNKDIVCYVRTKTPPDYLEMPSVRVSIPLDKTIGAPREIICRDETFTLW